MEGLKIAKIMIVIALSLQLKLVDSANESYLSSFSFLSILHILPYVHALLAQTKCIVTIRSEYIHIDRRLRGSQKPHIQHVRRVITKHLKLEGEGYRQMFWGGVNMRKVQIYIKKHQNTEKSTPSWG